MDVPPVAGTRSRLSSRSHRPGTIVVVDAYSSGRRLARELETRGHRLVHMASGLQPATDLSVSTEVFDLQLDAGRDEDAALEAIEPLSPIAVIPGCESGVLLADALALRLKLPRRNRADRAVARRDKFEMIAALMRAGLATADHFRSDDLAPIARWVERHGLPVVVKPPSSTGTDAVTICRHMEELAPAVDRVFSGTSKLSREGNHEVLVETFLDGEEYIVDTVVCEGHTFFSEFVHSKKLTTVRGYSLYDYQEVLPFDDPAFEGIPEYYVAVQSALGIEIGATHGELKRTAQGPKLIEVASRVGGGGITEFAEHCYKHSSFSAIADAYLAPERFATRYGQTNMLHERGLLLCMLNPKPCVLEQAVDEDAFSSLPSFSKLLWNYQVGETMPETVDLFTTPGFVYLTHEDRDQIHADREAVRSIENELFGGGSVD